MDGRELKFTGNYTPTTVLTGAAKECRTGPVDPITVGAHDIAYCYEVKLPCMARDIGELGTDVLCDGTVNIYGYTKSGVISWNSSPMVYGKRLRSVTPPASFSISFTLPGLIEPYFSKFEIRRDSIKGIVLRAGLPSTCRDHFYNNIQFS